MATYRHSLAVDLVGNLARRSRSFGRDLENFAQRGGRSLRTLGRAGEAAGRGLDRLGNRYAALATGAAAVGTLRYVGRLERSFTRLGIQANISAEEVEKIKQQVFDIANAPDIKLDPAELKSAIDAIVEKTGDIKFAEENMRNLGYAIQATGATGADIGALISEFRKFGLVTGDEVSQALNLLVSQGKAGAFTIANLAGQGERLASAFAATGQTGMGAIRQLGALAQISRQGTGSAEQATTALEAMFRTLQDGDKIKLLEQRGLRIVDPADPRRLRNVADIFQEIIRASRGDAKALLQVFDGEAIRAFNAAAAEFQKSGALPSFQKFLAVQSDGTELMKDSARAARDSVGAWQGVLNSWQKFADTNLAGPLKDVADALNSIDADKMQRILKTLAYGAAGVGGLLAARKVYRGGKALAGLFGKGGGVADAAAGLAGGGVQNVRVVNWPGTFNRNSGVGARRGGAAAGIGKTGRVLGRAGGLLGRLGGPAALAFGALEAVDVLTDSSLTGQQKATGLGGAAGGTGGAIGGMQLGAAAGAFGGPLAPVTVPAGMLIGGGLGYVLGTEIGERVGRAVADFLGLDGGGRPKEETKVGIEVKFSNAPQGTRNEVTTSRGANVRIDQGFSMLPTGP